MYGAILGDIIGSPYEFDRGNKTKDFPFFDKGATFTDDSVMTIAVAEALMQAIAEGVIENEAATKDLIIDSMHKVTNIRMQDMAAASITGSGTTAMSRTTALAMAQL